MEVLWVLFFVILNLSFVKHIDADTEVEYVDTEEAVTEDLSFMTEYEEEKRIIFVDQVRPKGGDKCNPGIANYTEPFYNTKCMKLQKCLSLISDHRKGVRVTKFCEYSFPLSESLVCCTIEDIEKSREMLRATRTKVRIQVLTKEDKYFNLQNCLARDQEFRHIAHDQYNAAPINYHLEDDDEKPFGIDQDAHQHVAAIGWSVDDKISWKCNGVLIHPEFVLTAGSCGSIDGARPTIVRLGDVSLKSKDDDNEVQEFAIQDFIAHPKYSPDNNHANDIALIKLSSRIRKSYSVLPACLNEEWDIEKSITTYYDAAAYGGSNERVLGTLLETEENCDSLDQLSQQIHDLGENQFCALSRSVQESRSSDTCKTDRGGPLQYIESTSLDYVTCNNPVVIGLNSLGSACSTIDKVNVYTKIGNYISWIEKVIFGEQP